MNKKKAVIERIGAAIERRSFLRQITLVSGSFILGVLGLPKSSEASGCGPGSVGFTYECCCLCKWPWNKNCLDDCSDIWGWVCQGTDPYEWWICYECFETCTNVWNTDTCAEGICSSHCCTDVKCSWAEQISG